MKWKIHKFTYSFIQLLDGMSRVQYSLFTAASAVAVVKFHIVVRVICILYPIPKIIEVVNLNMNAVAHCISSSSAEKKKHKHTHEICIYILKIERK